MMKLIECLNILPDDMEMIDTLEIDRNKKIKTVAQIKSETGFHANEEGYEVRDHKSNYGKTIKKAIAVKGSSHIYIESE